MVISQELVLVCLLANFISIAVGDGNSAFCERSCGKERVNYPFGFSEGCDIQLNCSDSSVSGEIELAGFKVHKVTSESIMVHLPTRCDRKVDEIRRLFNQNFAVSWQNALLLQSCSSSKNNCTIPTIMLENRFNLQGCDAAHRHGNVSCYPAAGNGVGMLSYEDIANTDCGLLFTSIVVDSVNEDSDFSLQLQTIQLDWWLLGRSNCSSDANSVTVKLANGSSGYRCSCRDGFTGDGFVQGKGCRRDSGVRATIIVLIGGILAGASAVGVLVLICYYIRRHSVSWRSWRSAKRLLCEAAGNSVLLYPYKEIERATCGFSEHKMLGTGAYGTVYEGRLHNGEFVAIKKIKNRDTDSIDKVMNEIKLISSVSHPNLVRLLGCCIEKNEQILVYEFMANGTLSQHLQREKGRVLPWTVRLTIATETAQAIAFLHSAMNPPIYHRDIKSSNMLLDYNYKSKVADFGLSRVGMTESSHISTAPQGTPGYVDPQYHQNFHLSDKSDVYSFGVVLVEIITAMKVVDFSRPHSDINLAALAVDRIGKGRLDDIIDPFLDPHRDAWTLTSIHKVAELAFRCLAYHRDMRPSMTEVAEELERIRLSGWASSDETASVASFCSSPFNASEWSLSSGSLKGAAGRRVVVPAKAVKSLASLEEGKDGSPVSVQDPWLSANSSPSAHSLLGNVIQ